jgi:predicted Zn-dependent protease
VEYSTKIGYDAKEMAGFFKTLERQSGGGEGERIPDFLSTHPNPGDRYNDVGKLANEWKSKLNLTNAQVNRNSYLKRIEGLVYGEDPKQGYVENSVFYHPGLKFQFGIPSGWRHQNSPSQFQMAPADGKALMMLMMAQGTSLKEAANAFIQQNNLQPLDSKETTVNGLPALAVVADVKQQQGQQGQQQQQQQQIRTISYFVKYGEHIFLMLGLSATQDFNSYVNLFKSTQESFKALTDAEKLNKKPERIHIKTVSSSATLEEILKGYNADPKRLEEFAILNGMKLTDRVEAGTLIKVVGL